VLRGTGGGHFAYQNDGWGNISHFAEASVDGGFAFGDIDADGDLDLLAFTSGDPTRQVALYRNDLPKQHWLNVRPVGLAGNKAAISSKIRIYEPGTDHLLWFEEVLAFSKQAQQNYYAFDALERHYGLGAHDKVDVTVTFYPSGTVVRKDGIATDSTVLIGEDGTNGIVEPPSHPTPSDAGAGGASMGGASMGGTAQGGRSMGGTSQGGASMGGASQAGTSRGGTSMGGSPGTSMGTASGGDSSPRRSSTGGTSPGDAGIEAKSANAAGCTCRLAGTEGDPRRARALTSLFALLTVIGRIRRKRRSIRR
jgi:hypothetical protein